MRRIADRRGRRLPFVVEDIANHDASPFRNKESSLCGAHAASATRNQRNFTFEIPSHSSLLSATRAKLISQAHWLNIG
jgi:hypothetical protein